MVNYEVKQYRYLKPLPRRCTQKTQNYTDRPANGNTALFLNR